MENQQQADRGETLSAGTPVTRPAKGAATSEDAFPVAGDESRQSVTPEEGVEETGIPILTRDMLSALQPEVQPEAQPEVQPEDAEQAESDPVEQPDPAAVTAGTVQAADPTSTQTDMKEDTYGTQAEALRAVYPTFDLEREMKDPAFRGLVCGEVRPTLAQAYTLCHGEELVAEAVRAAVEAAVAEAESRLTEHIAARGLRPCENGLSARGAVRMHPSVDHLTREDRAMLARRAGRGESIRL